MNPYEMSMSGDAGDVIMAAQALYSLDRPTNLKLTPADFTRVRMTPEWAENIASLLRVQPYIASAEFSTEPSQGGNLDGFRQFLPQFDGHCTISSLVRAFMGIPPIDDRLPWLTIPHPRKTYPVLFHRSARYHNQNFTSWPRIAKKYEGQCGVLGFPGEHRALCDLAGMEMPHVKTANALELGEVIAGCSMFFGNQSLPCAIAEGLKKLLIQETGPQQPTSRYARSDALYAFDDSFHLPEIPGDSPQVRATWIAREPFLSQHGEDAWMRDNWSTLGLPDKGYFVEVGACDGMMLSNTYWLEKAKGWTGMLVEPDPRWFEALDKNRPACRLIHCAASDYDGTADIGMMPNASHSGTLRDNAPFRKLCAARKLNTLFADNGVDRVDAMSIDTEGTELEIWRALDLSRWRPRLVIAEWDTVGISDRTAEMVRQWTVDGYALVNKIGANLIFLDGKTK